MKKKSSKAYREVEAQIEDSIRNGIAELALSWRDSADSLPSLSGLVHLTSLRLDGNLAALPDSLRTLTQLQSLDVSGNNLTELPEWLSTFTELRSLNLNHNLVTKLPEGQFVKLQRLLLSGCRIEPLPDWLGRLDQLQELDIASCGLHVVPAFLAGLTQLRSLTIANNELTSIPLFLSNLNQLEYLDISSNPFTQIPEVVARFDRLRYLNVGSTKLQTLPTWLVELNNLNELDVQENRLASVPVEIFQMASLKVLRLSLNSIKQLPEHVEPRAPLQVFNIMSNGLTSVPEWVGSLTNLTQMWLDHNRLVDLPASMGNLQHLTSLDLPGNELNPELEAAYGQGTDAVLRYLRAKADGQVTLNEAKLILVGEGEVGKSCLLGALRDDPWEEGRPTTHGIEIKSVDVVDEDTGTKITLNGWDFGGQRVYRPTHQLFFSAPAVYLVVWKPREGPQQGFVNEWIKLVKHREPDAKILVVATHGGPKERQPDIDRQEIWDLFGKDMVIDFFLVESKPDDKTQQRTGIEGLRRAIARVAAKLPEMGRQVPRRWEEVRNTLNKKEIAYLQLKDVLKLCRDRQMEDDETRDFVRVSHRLGHLIHYEHDPALRDIVILKPDWLTTALSFVLDDKQTRQTHGLVEFSRLGQLWDDPNRPDEFRYEPNLHPLFLRLMERFDISYKVAIPSEPEDAISFWQRAGQSLGSAKSNRESVSGLHYTSLVAQLVPDIRPNTIPGWDSHAAAGDEEQSQICRITETKNGQSATAEGLFFQLIVRLHKYSLGRFNYADSAHWQRGLVLQDDYGARALLEHVGNDVRITVRSPYPERFLAALTYEVKWLVENFWAGLRCDIMVPCLNTKPCIGLFEVSKLLENKKRNRPEQPCPICNEWQDIELLLHNAPAARPNPLNELLANSEMVIGMLGDVRRQLGEQVGRFDNLEASSKELVSKVEAAYSGLMRMLIDEAKDGPRLFSFEPVEPGFFDRPKWVSQKFRVTLWCEHSRLPLPALNGKDDKRGVYELAMPREWVVKAAPFLKILMGTLSLVAPVAASTTKFILDDASYKGIEKQLDLSQKSLDFVTKGGQQAGAWLAAHDTPDVDEAEAMRAQGGVLRQLHAWLKEKDPSFGGLVRVQNKRQEFLWVHSKFETEY